MPSKEWTSLQKELLSERFDCLQQSEKRRALGKDHDQGTINRPQWCKLWRMMGVRHIVAFGLMAIIGDVNRFPNAKKLVGYIGLSPSKVQSGNNVKGREKGTGNTGRGDVRALLVQSAQADLPCTNGAGSLL